MGPAWPVRETLPFPTGVNGSKGEATRPLGRIYLTHEGKQITAVSEGCVWGSQVRIPADKGDRGWADSGPSARAGSTTTCPAAARTPHPRLSSGCGAAGAATREPRVRAGAAWGGGASGASGSEHPRRARSLPSRSMTPRGPQKRRQTKMPSNKSDGYDRRCRVGDGRLVVTPAPAAGLGGQRERISHIFRPIEWETGGAVLTAWRRPRSLRSSGAGRPLPRGGRTSTCRPSLRSQQAPVPSCHLGRTLPRVRGSMPPRRPPAPPGGAGLRVQEAPAPGSGTWGAQTPEGTFSRPVRPSGDAYF